MADEYINKKDVVNLGVMMQTHLWTREQTYNAIFCLPSADVAPVVRCGDCKYLMASGICNMFADDNIKPSASDFCSYGERKDDDIC